MVTFSFVDPGLLSLASFESHLFAYQPLFAAVPRVNFVYIATRLTHFDEARRRFLVMAPTVMNPDPGVEGLRYFHNRYLWETKQYAKLNDDQIQSLNEAQKRFTDPGIETLFHPWMHGQITCDVVMHQFQRLAPKREVSFRTELVDGQTALFEANLPRRTGLHAASEVTDPSELTFGSDFKAAFAAEDQETEQN